MFSELKSARLFFSDICGLDSVQDFRAEAKVGLFLKQVSKFICGLKQFWEFFEDLLEIFLYELECLREFLDIDFIGNVADGLLEGGNQKDQEGQAAVFFIDQGQNDTPLDLN